MYLSKIILDLKHPSVRQALWDCHDMHRNVQKWFDFSRQQSMVLYRLYQNREKYVLYVLSKDRLQNLAGNGASLVGCRDMGELEQEMAEGKSYRFDLMAVPSKKIKSEGKNSRRIALRDPKECAVWLARKGEQNGFELLTVMPEPGGVVSGQRGTNRIIFDAVHYRGVLQITRADLFRQAWEKGIGPEKAYGMGLLLLVQG